MQRRMQKVILMAVIFLAAAAYSIGIAATQPIAAPDAAPSRTPASAPFVAGLPENGGPMVVRARFQLRDIYEIDDEAERFEFGGVLTLTWKDERQTFDPAVIGADEKVYQGAYQFNEVFSGWFPQVVLVNESGLYEELGVVLTVQPDGTMTLVTTVNAAAQTDIDLRRFPFDRQRLEAVFEALGFDKDEVRLEAGAATVSPRASKDDAILPQWRLAGISTSVRDRPAPYAGSRGVASAFVMSLDLERKSLFMVRLVILPLMLMVMLSWSVFWMDRSSLGDRISVSFIGILTVVAYQLVVSEMLPRIAYLTWMNGFLNFSFLIICASVVINLVVGQLDQRGKAEVGDRIDRRCRRIFPLTYLGLLSFLSVLAFLFA